MPYVDWSKRYACQKRWKRENRAKVRAQKRRARIKKKCLSKSLVVVLEDCCKKDNRLRRKLYQRNRKRMSTPVTKTLTVVLEDYRKKKLPTPPPKNKEKIKTDYYRPDYYQRNRERIRAQRKECRQRNLEKYRARERERTSRRRQNSRGAQRTEYRQHLQGAQKRCVELQKEWRRKNRDVVNERRRDYYQRNRERIRAQRKEYRQKNLERCRTQDRKSSRRYWRNSRGAERQKEWRRKNREVINERRRQHRVAITPCDCGLCLTCGGYETESWSRRVVVPRSDPLEAMERRLNQLDPLEAMERRLDRLEAACSDTSSEVDPGLEEELERLLNEPSSDEASEEEEDVVEQRLASLRRKREEDMTRRLARWEREEAVTDLSTELGGVQSELRDMERWFEQFHREDEVQPNEYTQTLMVTSHLMNELERFLFSQ